MKISKDLPQLELQTPEVPTLLSAQSQHRAVLNALPALCQQKSTIKIEQTILWSTHSEGKTLTRMVFYRKPLLNRQGKLDKERLALEILSQSKWR